MVKLKTKPPTIYEIVKRPDPLLPGHRMCAGCTAPAIVKLVLKALPSLDNVIVVSPTGCLEVATTIFPYTSWAVPWMHNAFENAAATAAGIEAAYKALKKKGVWDGDVPKIIIFGGDGGTVDIGLQALSGMVERGHNVMYILYDNEAYMNTGIQRSGSTPFAAATTTSPAGKVIPGKIEWKKPISLIIAAHLNAYVATASLYYWQDFVQKVLKAYYYEGPSFIHAIQPCDRGWRFTEDLGIKLTKLAVDTCVHPLWEFDPETREFRVTGYSAYLAKHPEKILPVEEYLKLQGRFRHLFKPVRRDDLIKEIQDRVMKDWHFLLKLAGLE